MFKESLAGIREELLKEISGLSDRDANQKPSEEEWSVAQVLEHLHLVERAVASQIRHGMYEESDRPFDPRPVERTLDRTIKVKVPNPALEPKNEVQELSELTEKLARSREQLEESLAGFTLDELERKAFGHPAFGMLSLKQWVDFLLFHEQRHLEQIREIKERLKIPQKTDQG
jgi:uncharacterized damage-inducible protein DinB